MEGNDEELTEVQTSDEMLSDLRKLSVQCRAHLYQLSADAGLTDTNKAEARKLVASFNIWTSSMGVFLEGWQSLTSRLKGAPQISRLLQRLLKGLERNLVNALAGMEEDDPSSSDSDDSSDRVYSYAELQATKDENAPPPRRSTVWTPMQNIIISLHQLAMNIRRTGARHRQERIQRFKNLDRNKNVYETFERYARQKVDYMFPNSSNVLRERMAESIATRRARFSYLEQHQKKTSTLNEPAPALEQTEVDGKENRSIMPASEPRGQQVVSWEQPSVILSSTVATKLDPKQLDPSQNEYKRAESVSSVKITTGTLPPVPKLDPGGTSFTCPYCSLICPAKEASGQSQWMSHIIHDFEPFFCVFDDCRSPFTCADSYTSWLTHIRNTHIQPEWHCWYCDTASYTRFSSPVELESHLTEYHRENVTDSLRPTVVRHSMMRDRRTLQECPFCGGFPDDIDEAYPDRSRKQAIEALEKHVRDHLISVSLILAPAETEESEGDVDDTILTAQADNVSECDPDEVGDTYELECQNDLCDCKEKEKDSIPDWPGSDSCEITDTQMGPNIPQLWQGVFEEKISGEEVDSILDSYTGNFRPNQPPLHSSPLIASSLGNRGYYNINQKNNDTPNIEEANTAWVYDEWRNADGPNAVEADIPLADLGFPIERDNNSNTVDNEQATDRTLVSTDVNGEVATVVHGFDKPRSKSGYTLATFNWFIEPSGQTLREITLEITFEADGPRGGAEKDAEQRRRAMNDGSGGVSDVYWNPEVVKTVPMGTSWYSQSTEVDLFDLRAGSEPQLGYPWKSVASNDNTRSLKLIGELFLSGFGARPNVVRWVLRGSESLPTFLRTAVLLRRRDGDNGDFIGHIKALRGSSESPHNRYPIIFNPRMHNPTSSYDAYTTSLASPQVAAKLQREFHMISELSG